MNESAPLPAAMWPRRYQKVDVNLDAAERWRQDFALGLQGTDPETDWSVWPTAWPKGGGSIPGNFHWLWTGAESGRPGGAFQLSTDVSKRALQVAVSANGGALVALAFLQLMDESSRAGMPPVAIAWALGLVLAGISTVLAYLNLQLADSLWLTRATKRGLELSASASGISVSDDLAYRAVQSDEMRTTVRVTASFWLATFAGAGSYAVFGLGAFWFMDFAARS